MKGTASIALALAAALSSTSPAAISEYERAHWLGVHAQIDPG